MANRGAIALWCHTVMRRVHGNTINTMARISLLFGISRVGSMSGHYLREGNEESDTRDYINGKICGNLISVRELMYYLIKVTHHFLLDFSSMWSSKMINHYTVCLRSLVTLFSDPRRTLGLFFIVPSKHNLAKHYRNIIDKVIQSLDIKQIIGEKILYDGFLSKRQN